MLARQCFSLSSQRCLSWESHTKACEFSTYRVRTDEAEPELGSSMNTAKYMQWLKGQKVKDPRTDSSGRMQILPSAFVPSHRGTSSRITGGSNEVWSNKCFSFSETNGSDNVHLAGVSRGLSTTTCSSVCHTKKPVIAGGVIWNIGQRKETIVTTAKNTESTEPSPPLPHETATFDI